MPVFIKGAGGGYATEQITNLSAQVGFNVANKVTLNWTNPTDENFKGLVIRYKAGSYPTGPTDGYLFYDSNDAVPVSTCTLTGGNLVDGTMFYFRAFAYCYEGATRAYNDTMEGASVLATPLQTQGMVTLTASGTFVVPAGVTDVDVFLVGGGGAGGPGYYYSSTAKYGGGGGGGGYTAKHLGVSVTPGDLIPVAIGAGGVASTGANASNIVGSSGGSTSFGAIIANGGAGGRGYHSTSSMDGGAGGSGGGGGGVGLTSYPHGAVNGGNGLKPTVSSGQSGDGGIGQGTSTQSFNGTVFSGGGGGSSGNNSYYGTGGSGGGGDGARPYTPTDAQPGAANTGGGGGGGSANQGATATSRYGAAGGSGIAIIRWGY